MTPSSGYPLRPGTTEQGCSEGCGAGPEPHRYSATEARAVSSSALAGPPLEECPASCSSDPYPLPSRAKPLTQGSTHCCPQTALVRGCLFPEGESGPTVAGEQSVRPSHRGWTASPHGLRQEAPCSSPPQGPPAPAPQSTRPHTATIWDGATVCANIREGWAPSCPEAGAGEGGLAHPNVGMDPGGTWHAHEHKSGTGKAVRQAACSGRAPGGRAGRGAPGSGSGPPGRAPPGQSPWTGWVGASQPSGLLGLRPHWPLNSRVQRGPDKRWAEDLLSTSSLL